MLIFRRPDDCGIINRSVMEFLRLSPLLLLRCATVLPPVVFIPYPLLFLRVLSHRGNSFQLPFSFEIEKFVESFLLRFLDDIVFRMGQEKYKVYLSEEYSNNKIIYRRSNESMRYFSRIFLSFLLSLR